MAEDWYGLPFLAIWGIVAVFLGSVFAFQPEWAESEYRRMVNRTRFTKQLAERNAPSDWVIKFYRAGGYVFLVLGIAGLVVGVLGTIGFAVGLLPFK
jgi:hypothetical protein